MNSHASAQVCGCDPGANHQCQMHKDQATLETIPSGDEAVFNFDHLSSVAAPVASAPSSAPKPNAMVGIGGAPTRASILPVDPHERKQYPVASGFMDYFPDAIAAIANLSYIGNEQHNANQPLHWARGKSADEADTMMRHFLQRGTLDSDGVRHTVKMAWRAMALLQKELEQESR